LKKEGKTVKIIESQRELAKTRRPSPRPLKTSRYNHFIRVNKSEIYGYNLLYRTMLRIPAEAYAEISACLNILHQKKPILPGKKISNFPIPGQWMKALKDSYFIIDDDFDELSFIKFRYYRTLYANDSLSLVILPTLWCNLNCPYCFEFKRRVFMTREVEKAIMKWLEDSFRSKRNVYIAWFGGEPLLGRQSILRLTAMLQSFCKDISANYGASLTTNGVFFDRAFQQSLPNLGIKQVQITLDGDRDDHNKLRLNRSGSGSFDQIYKNIISFCKHAYPCHLTLRINCCDENYDQIEKLLERFPAFVRERVSLFFRWLWPNEATGYREFSTACRGPEPFRGLAKLYGSAQALGWHTHNPIMSYNGVYCEVDYTDHYSIDPNGNVYLCSHTYQPSESIGSVLRMKDRLRSDAVGSYTKWYAADPFDDEACIACPVLPVCLGGCRRARVGGRRQCIEEKRSVEKFINSIIDEKVISSKAV
jgi:uncharacterized protein